MLAALNPAVGSPVGAEETKLVAAGLICSLFCCRYVAPRKAHHPGCIFLDSGRVRHGGDAGGATRPEGDAGPPPPRRWSVSAPLLCEDMQPLPDVRSWAAIDGACSAFASLVLQPFTDCTRWSLIGCSPSLGLPSTRRHHFRPFPLLLPRVRPVLTPMPPMCQLRHSGNLKKLSLSSGSREWRDMFCGN